MATHNKTQLINSSRVGQGHGLGPVGPGAGSPQHLGSNLQGRMPAGRQHGSNLASPKQVNSATGMPAAAPQQSAQYQGGKRTIVSGIVRRQPLPAGQTTEHYAEPAEGYMPPASAAGGGGQPAQAAPGTLTGPVGQSGAVNNKISFYPTGPTRQSQLQAQQQPYYHAKPLASAPHSNVQTASMQGNRQATTSHGRRGNSTQQTSNARAAPAQAGAPVGAGHTLQSKWARLMHGHSPDQVSLNRKIAHFRIIPYSILARTGDRRRRTNGSGHEHGVQPQHGRAASRVPEAGTTEYEVLPAETRDSRRNRHGPAQRLSDLDWKRRARRGRQGEEVQIISISIESAATHRRQCRSIAQRNEEQSTESARPL